MPWGMISPEVPAPGLVRALHVASIKSAVDERCCSPNNSLKEPKVNNQSDNDFMHSMVFGKTYAFSH
jgi:hypothetical protein